MAQYEAITCNESSFSRVLVQSSQSMDILLLQCRSYSAARLLTTGVGLPIESLSKLQYDILHIDMSNMLFRARYSKLSHPRG